MKLISKDVTVSELLNRETGELARKEREAAGLSLREVARRMKTSAPYLSDLERGNRLWNETLVEKFNAAIK